jgi:LAO/AO transport system kinase
MWERIDAELKQRFKQHAGVRAALAATQDLVRNGKLPASTAARQLLGIFDQH